MAGFIVGFDNDPEDIFERQIDFIDGERKEFWRFLSKALVQHHNLLADALRLAAMGYHFRKLNCAYASSAFTSKGSLKEGDINAIESSRTSSPLVDDARNVTRARVA